jgi:phosphoserine phosphatase RsbU/P
MAVESHRASHESAEAGESIRDELLGRRAKLEAVRGGLPERGELRRLLSEVDAALERLQNGTYGVCEVCRGAIEPGRLAADPLARTCLEDLTADEQHALEQDLDLTRQIQHVLLPQNRLSFDGWNTFYEYQPLGAASGDYCDLIVADEGDLLFLLGDVAGKGVAASVLMAHLHAMFRSLVSMRLPFEHLMQRANRIFCESTGGLHYATLVCGRAVANAGEVEICNAGHCPPIWIRDDELIDVPATGLPIGLFCSAPWSVTRLTFAPGDTLLLYTDGVTEARDASGAEYGVDRLSLVAQQRRQGSAADLVTACAADLLQFVAGAARADDVTLFALQRGHRG